MEGVTDRSAESKYVIGVEIGGVIEDAVVISFGADKEFPPHAVVESPTHVKQKVIAVQMGGATGRVTAVAVGVVVKHGLATRADGEDGAGSLRHPGGERVQMGCEYEVEVIEHGAILLIAVVVPFLVSKGKFGVVAEAVLEDAIEAGAGVDSASLRWGQVGQGSVVVLGGEQSVAPRENVNLLGMR